MSELLTLTNQVAIIKSQIKTAIINKGVSVSDSDAFSTYPTKISNISASNIQSLSVTPTTSSQTITASGGVDGYSPITVSAVTSSIDSNISAANIVSGVSILGVSGSAIELNGDTLSVTPSTSAQTLTPTSPKNGFTEVSVSAVTSSIDANITAGNIKKGVQILGVTGTYEGSGGGEFQLTRFKDDTNTEIGTHYMNFTDGNGNTYKVILLDAQYRLAESQWADATGSVTNMPSYSNLKKSNVWQARQTATTNTQYILDWCTANNHTSTACTHCRSKSFTIGGTVYYGQLPNMIEVINLAQHYNQFNAMDTSASSHSSLNFSSAHEIWSSSQYNGNYGWYMYNFGGVNVTGKDNIYFACPVLEIPA